MLVPHLSNLSSQLTRSLETEPACAARLSSDLVMTLGTQMASDEVAAARALVWESWGESDDEDAGAYVGGWVGR